MIRISENELNLRTIMDSGQCFRIFIVEESYFVAVYDVIAMNKYVRVYHVKSEGAYFFNCDKSEWDFWNMYFDLDTNYEKFYIAIANSDDNFLKDAAEYGKGMRILRQSFWEALISFIISQNNNIPRIKKSIELLCEKFGKPIERYGMVRYSFPNAKDLENVTMDDLSDLGLGYRATYIYGVCKRNPALVMPNYDMLLAIPGIGKKVASCIMLFGAYDLTQFPIDTWMKKLLDEVYNGRFDTTPYKGFEGFIQQLQFYYYRHLKGK
jgi:N-glycosylase/DNA lyase